MLFIIVLRNSTEPLMCTSGAYVYLAADRRGFHDLANRPDLVVSIDLIAYRICMTEEGERLWDVGLQEWQCTSQCKQ